MPEQIAVLISHEVEQLIQSEHNQTVRLGLFSRVPTANVSWQLGDRCWLSRVWSFGHWPRASCEFPEQENRVEVDSVLLIPQFRIHF